MSIATLKRLGPKSREMLAQAGITSVTRLQAIGADAACAKAKAVTPGTSLDLSWTLESGSHERRIRSES